MKKQESGKGKEFIMTKQKQPDSPLRKVMNIKTTMIHENYPKDPEDFQEFFHLLTKEFERQPLHKLTREIMNKRIENFFNENIFRRSISKKLGNSICEFMKRSLEIN